MAEMTYMQFYFSYFEAMEMLTDAERGRLVSALMKYAMSGVKQEFSGNEKYLYAVMRAQRDRDVEAYNEKCRKNSESGKLGGRPKKANGFFENQTVLEKSEKSQSKGKGKGKSEGKSESESNYPVVVDARDNAFGLVMSHFMDNYASTPSPKIQDDVKSYLADMEPEVIIEAINVALGENKRSWSYVTGILRSWRGAGVKNTADVVREREEWESRKRGGTNTSRGKKRYTTAADAAENRPVGPSATELERMEKLLASIKEAER